MGARTEWWWKDAACRGKWALFDSHLAADHKRAKKICRSCPVFFACHEEMLDALADPEISLVGTWAGRLYTSRGGVESQRTTGKSKAS